MVLSDKRIVEEMEHGNIVIEPFELRRIIGEGGAHEHQHQESGLSEPSSASRTAMR